MHRVFAAGTIIEPGALLEALHQAGFVVEGHFRGDDQGWFAARLLHEGVELALERYLVQEEDLRGDLNAWAAWVEARADASPDLVTRLIATQEMFTLDAPLGQAALAEWLCRYLAQQGQGLYQIDGRGLFDAAGRLLVCE